MMFAHNHSIFVSQHVKWLLFYTLTDHNTITQTHYSTVLYVSLLKNYLTEVTSIL